MLNIDYSNKRKFLMSLGITLIFFGFLLYFGTAIFVVERTENIFENWITENPEDPNVQDYNQYLEEIHVTILRGAIIPMVFSGILMLVGFLLLIYGYKIWKYDNFKDKG